MADEDFITIDGRKFKLVKFYYGFDADGKREFAGYLLRNAEVSTATSPDSKPNVTSKNAS